MKHLYPYLRRFRKESILAPLFKMLEATFDLLVPMVVADIIKVGIAGGDTTYIWTRCGLLVLMHSSDCSAPSPRSISRRAPPSAHPLGCGMS